MGAVARRLLLAADESLGPAFLRDMAMNLPSSALPTSVAALRTGNPAADVVEIGLLLPAHRAQALMDLSRRRKQTVGQILRQMIEESLERE